MDAGTIQNNKWQCLFLWLCLLFISSPFHLSAENNFTIQPLSSKYYHPQKPWPMLLEVAPSFIQSNDIIEIRWAGGHFVISGKHCNQSSFIIHIYNVKPQITIRLSILRNQKSQLLVEEKYSLEPLSRWNGTNKQSQDPRLIFASSSFFQNRTSMSLFSKFTYKGDVQAEDLEILQSWVALGGNLYIEPENLATAKNWFLAYQVAPNKAQFAWGNLLLSENIRSKPRKRQRKKYDEELSQILLQSYGWGSFRYVIAFAFCGLMIVVLWFPREKKRQIICLQAGLIVGMIFVIIMMNTTFVYHLEYKEWVDDIEVQNQHYVLSPLKNNHQTQLEVISFPTLVGEIPYTTIEKIAQGWKFSWQLPRRGYVHAKTSNVVFTKETSTTKTPLENPIISSWMQRKYKAPIKIFSTTPQNIPFYQNKKSLSLITIPNEHQDN